MGLLAFCAYMTFIYLPWDVFIKPLEVDQEVWFGILFTGWAAKAGALLHWLVYGAGTLGLWHMRAWLQPWLSLYLLQIAYGMAYWSLTDPRGSGLAGRAHCATSFCRTRRLRMARATSLKLTWLRISKLSDRCLPKTTSNA
jgi:hypothetical protein